MGENYSILTNVQVQTNFRGREMQETGEPINGVVRIQENTCSVFRLISEALVESCGEDVGNTYLALLHQCCGLRGERYLSAPRCVRCERGAQSRAGLSRRSRVLAQMEALPRGAPVLSQRHRANCSNRCLYSVRLWFFSSALCYLRKEGSTSLYPLSVLQQIRDVPTGYNRALYPS